MPCRAPGPRDARCQMWEAQRPGLRAAARRDREPGTGNRACRWLLTEVPRKRVQRPTARLRHCSGTAAGGGRASPRVGAPNPGLPPMLPAAQPRPRPPHPNSPFPFLLILFLYGAGLRCIKIRKRRCRKKKKKTLAAAQGAGRGGRRLPANPPRPYPEPRAYRVTRDEFLLMVRITHPHFVLGVSSHEAAQKTCTCFDH